MDAFNALYRSLSAKRRRQLLLTLLVMLAGALAEMLTIGAALPFLALVASVPDRGADAQALMLRFGVGGGDAILAASLLLSAAAVAAAVLRLLLLWLIQSFVRALGQDISAAIFGRMLRQPYALYVERNSSELLAGMEKVGTVIFGVVQPAMQAAVAAIIALFIAGLLLLIHPFAAAAAAASVAAVYAAVMLATYRPLRRNAATLTESPTARTKIVQEGLGGLRDILLDRSQPHFEAKFAAIDARYRRAYAANSFMAAAPRFVVEAGGIVAIALVAFLMSRRSGGIAEAIPVLGALALGAQRLLPLLQQAYSGWSQAAGNVGALADVVALMHAPVAEAPPPDSAAPLPRFARNIVFDRVSFRHGSGRFALRDIDLTIEKGERIGISGPTGSGKSTLLDLLTGLLEPSAGEIRIDGRRLDPAGRRAWQAQLAHVPQAVYLADASIAANIAFGTEDRIDRERMIATAKAARLDDFVRSLPQGYETLVGERGVRLSGGQRQRIGIARALYKRPSILILDEATNALDDETEAAILDALADLGDDLTVIMVSHRQTALRRCGRVVALKEGRLVSEGPAGAVR